MPTRRIIALLGLGFALAAGASPVQADDDPAAPWPSRVLKDKKQPPAPIKSLAFDAKGRILVAHRVDAVQVWDLKKERGLHLLKGRDGGGWTAALAPNGKVIAGSAPLSQERADLLLLWSASTGEVLRTSTRVGGRYTALAFSPNSKLLAGGTQDKTLEVWRVRDGNGAQALPQQCSAQGEQQCRGDGG